METMQQNDSEYRSIESLHGALPMQTCYTVVEEETAGQASLFLRRVCFPYRVHAIGTAQALGDLPEAEKTVVPDDRRAWQTLMERLDEGGAALLPYTARTAMQRLVQHELATLEQFPPAMGILHWQAEEKTRYVADVARETTGGAELLAATCQKCAQALSSRLKKPRVALLAAVEVASEGLPVTMIEEEASKLLAGQEALAVHGPLSMDLAVSEVAARKKGVQSEVAGQADLLVAPSLTIALGVLQASALHGECAVGVVFCGSTHRIACPVTPFDTASALVGLSFFSESRQ